ncbi:uncharacterized protein METZ01_LOCUS213645, partial [marine metagenome]
VKGDGDGGGYLMVESIKKLTYGDEIDSYIKNTLKN